MKQSIENTIILLHQKRTAINNAIEALTVVQGQFGDTPEQLPAVLPPAKPAPTPKPKSSVRRSPVRTVPKAVNGNTGSLVSAIRHVLQGIPGNVTAAQVKELAAKHDSTLGKKLVNVSVALLDMSNRGELYRTPATATMPTTFRVKKLKTSVPNLSRRGASTPRAPRKAAEPASSTFGQNYEKLKQELNIAVPRDPDVDNS